MAMINSHTRRSDAASGPSRPILKCSCGRVSFMACTAAMPIRIDTQVMAAGIAPAPYVTPAASSAGMINEKNDAASITPAAKPSAMSRAARPGMRPARTGSAPTAVISPAARLPRKPRAVGESVSIIQGPFPGPEHRHPITAVGDPVNIRFWPADHPIDVDHAAVAAPRRHLLGRQGRAIDKTFGIALPQRDMAGGIFVIKRVVKQQPRLRDRRGMRHQCNFAQTARALIAVQQLVQHRLALAGAGLGDAACLKTHLDIFDQAALMR